MAEYLDLADYLIIAGAILDREPEEVASFTDLPLAESAIAAPAAEFAGVEFYPSLPAKAAVLAWHIVRNHALPDGNKRVGFLAMVEFIERNGARFRLPSRGDDEVVEVIVGVAAGEITVEKLVGWLEGLIDH